MNLELLDTLDGVIVEGVDVVDQIEDRDDRAQRDDRCDARNRSHQHGGAHGATL